jgi:dGTPase
LVQFCYGSTNLGADPNSIKSLECQIMDIADDIAYSSFDLVDGAQARFITSERLKQWANENGIEPELETYFGQLVEMVRINRIVPRISRVLGDLIQSCTVEPSKFVLGKKTNRHAWKVVLYPAARQRIELHKRICKDLIYGSTALRQIEFKGRQLLEAMAKAFLDNYLSSRSPQPLVPASIHRHIMGTEGTKARARLVCDYISGMTDAYAVRCYRRLFDPTYGSISELI